MDVAIEKCITCCARVGAQAKRKAPQYIDFVPFFCRDQLSLYGKKTPRNVLPCYGGQITIPRQKIDQEKNCRCCTGKVKYQTNF